MIVSITSRVPGKSWPGNPQRFADIWGDLIDSLGDHYRCLGAMQVQIGNPSVRRACSRNFCLRLGRARSRKVMPLPQGVSCQKRK